ncbi:hypothetical protein GCM10008171_10840 [Methylopila jiangsuensis]|uniref:Uncharacterized protein n=1 Tax=Methylopila jiangsuensis TaxID=586230 RepID=A0A9W6JHA6_9HYPH|nr:hypothetical protein [Methylopila jiangsuensis]MDR6286072.1 hypothetical protein [Methylopila jiangsuensis]GLK75830.1 hypothetical protein GCM10008171_10840 [Methylopila jiangsuensis]
MSKPPQLTLEDYEAIASAVMETERGRWFLAEFARRNRVADTAEVLEALTRLEQRMAPRTPDSRVDAACPPAVAEAAAAVRAALMAPKPAELRVELALARLATLERLAKPGPDAAALEGPPLPEPHVPSVARLPATERAAQVAALERPDPVAEPAREPPAGPVLVASRTEPAVPPPPGEPATVEPDRSGDDTERSAASSARPATEAALTTLETPTPVSAASTDSPAVRLAAAPRRLAPAARREERPAPAPLPPLLESLSEADRALLFA